MILAKGFWKPVLTAAPIIGSVFFLLKAELKARKSPRERQFLLLHDLASVLDCRIHIVVRSGSHPSR